MASFKERLQTQGIQFQDLYHLKQVLVHPSSGKTEFERYEFLGDRVLGLVVAIELMKQPELTSESKLSDHHSLWVNKHTLARLGKLLQLDELIQVRGRVKSETLLADGFEALIGAIYLDQGLERVKKLWKKMKDRILPASTSNKTQLQEWAHKRGTLPLYVCQRVGGSDHQPLFSAELSVGALTTSGSGSSKKEAESDAASKFVEKYL